MKNHFNYRLNVGVDKIIQLKEIASILDDILKIDHKSGDIVGVKNLQIEKYKISLHIHTKMRKNWQEDGLQIRFKNLNQFDNALYYKAEKMLNQSLQNETQSK